MSAAPLLISILSLLVTIGGFVLSTYSSNAKFNQKFGEMMAKVAAMEQARTEQKTTDERISQEVRDGYRTRFQAIESKIKDVEDDAKRSLKSLEDEAKRSLKSLEDDAKRSNERHSERLAVATAGFRSDLRTEMQEVIGQLRGLSESVTELKVAVREVQIGKVSRVSGYQAPVRPDPRRDDGGE